ncbi:hypothetical protein G6M89_15780 [Natronolimnobius sp. AArcel1]|uniref:HalOD1 output domain-containing protein n=1 Tax=Natronolimnobius sp. AArcel1 TaxID=1679093 RepID=UPI0013EB46D0|nr:HalOD1 output domain-containing protein [Natronolimnobius sp. AArcel1]NGM70443.1 hypothetical protein [Natronolimnobius sp. AArcel1]
MDSHAPSYQVVEAVAQKEGVSPSELSPPLFHVVDPEALDALAQPDGDSSTPVEITFHYREYVVRVESGPEVSISVEDSTVSVDSSQTASEQPAHFED